MATTSLILLYAVVSLLLILQAGFLRDRYTRTFTYLALAFVVFFYVVPLSVAAQSGSLGMAGIIFRFDEAEVRSAGTALLLFCGGFAGADWIIRMHSDARPPSESLKLDPENRALEIIVAIMLIGVAIYAFRNDLYAQTTAIRRNEAAESSYLFATFLISIYYVGCFYVLRALDHERPLKAFLWTALCLLISVNFAGRASLLLLISLPVMHYIRRPELSLMLIPVSIALLFPLIAHGKEVVYAIMMRGDVSTIIANAYSNKSDLFNVLGNVSHPVISFNYAPALVERFGGFRYFWDIPQGILFYLRLIGIDMGDSLTYYNSEAILHIRSSVVPPGYMAFGYIQAGMVGVVISGMIFRYIGFFLGKLRSHFQGRSLATDFYLAFLAANTFYIGEPRALVLTLLLPIIILSVLLILSRRATIGHRKLAAG